MVGAVVAGVRVAGCAVAVGNGEAIVSAGAAVEGAVVALAGPPDPDDGLAVGGMQALRRARPTSSPGITERFTVTSKWSISLVLHTYNG
jgi:hypothetical protein